MTQEEITEGNELIAEFMGLNPNPWDKGKTWSKIIDVVDGQVYGKWECLNYRESWDWLMPVVEKIETMVIKTNITTNIFAMRVEQDDFNDIVIDFKHKGISKIEGVYLGCVRFIKWHNKQQ